MKELIPKIQNRDLPEKWDYDEEIQIGKKEYSNIKGDLFSLAKRLWTAQEKLSPRGPFKTLKSQVEVQDRTSIRDFKDFYEAIGIPKQTVYWLLNKYDPIKNRIEQTPIKEKQIADEVEPIKRGSVYRLGNHTLFCGDNRDSDFIEFCSREKYPFVFADPPYNSTDADFDGSFEWEHDYLSEWGKIVAVTPGISNLQSFFKKTTMPYKWAMSFYIDNGMTRGAMGFGNWILVALFSEDSINRQAQDHYQISITSKDKGFKHKGKKPLDVMRYLIEVFTEPGDTIIDPFLGSGSSLIGAEAQGRKLIGCEIDPLYGAKIIKRWEAFSGGNAILD